jgi:glycosyltransferase involved in cell wall biosynthesis
LSAEPPSISVVIPTYQRREGCRRAVESALGQDQPPLEVLVCDDGSTDGTEQAMSEWAESEPRLRYLRLSQNHGGPARARNLGIQKARGGWVAFLDSDDRWEPEKLAIQREFLSSGRYDVVASDAAKESGGTYFGLTSPHEPKREEFLAHNPIIVSTAVARRSMLVRIGGFPHFAGRFSATGVEDYGAWLSLVMHGARFLVLPRALITYADSGDRISAAVAHQEAGVAALRWRLWRQQPRDLAVLRSAVRASVDAVRWQARSRRRAREPTGKR